MNTCRKHSFNKLLIIVNILTVGILIILSAPLKPKNEGAVELEDIVAPEASDLARASDASTVGVEAVLAAARLTRASPLRASPAWARAWVWARTWVWT